jgi:hypothetical protein
MNTLSAAAALAVLTVGILQLLAHAQTAVEAGMLTCNGSSAWGFVGVAGMRDGSKTSFRGSPAHAVPHRQRQQSGSRASRLNADHRQDSGKKK